MDGQWGKTPLHWAAGYNHCETAEVLLAAGAGLNAKDRVTSLECESIT